MRESDIFSRVSKSRVSVIWRHLLLMLVVLAMSIAALAVSNAISLKTLERENHREIQTALDRNGRELANEMQITGAIPGVITDTWHFDYIRGIHEGVLPGKYMTVLPLIQRSLNNQVNLRGDAEYVILYIKGCNSIISTLSVNAVAESFFAQDILFPQTSTSLLLGYLKDTNVTKLLPAQTVRIRNNSEYISNIMLPLVIRKIGSSASIMSLYSQDVILEKLGMSHFPEDTWLQLTADDGQILMQYPLKFTSNDIQDRIAFTTNLPSLRASVSIYVSSDAYTSLLRPARLTGVALIILVSILGFILSLILSRISVDPLRKLLARHSEDPVHSNNEITHLGNILTRSQERVQGLENALVNSLLVKAFSGVALTLEDEQLLQQQTLIPGTEYRTAVIGAQPQVIAGLCPQLTEIPGTSLAPITSSQVGIVFSSNVAVLENLIQKHNETSQPSEQVRCGISAPFSELALLQTSARQARFAVPAEPGTVVFQGEHLQSHIYSRLQHERLYQSIFQSEREGAMAVLDSISQQLTLGSAREVYYNIRFTLRSAAEEMELDLSVFETEYMPDKDPQENMENLREMLDLMFLQICRKRDGLVTSLHDQVLEWIRENAFDPDLCVASIGEHFSMSKNKVYDLVRSATDMGLNDYLLSIRMKKAGNLLYSTQLSVGEVALQCGYLAESTFYRVFKKYFGITPAQYRHNGALPENE